MKMKATLAALALSLSFGAQAADNNDPLTEEGLTPSHAAAPGTNHLTQQTDYSASAFNNDLWQRIRNGFNLPELDNDLVAKHEQWYANRPDYVARMTERASRYLFFITEEVEKRGMPTEIALLPMIESAFNPGAYSISHASGIWQFIPSTGKNYGMEQNWWYDGRRDIISATRGALDYLQKLHDNFGDWQLALAAYNWGEGAVARAQAKNASKGLPTDYASLNMPDETRNYVPKLLAIKHIIANPMGYGLMVQDIPNQPYFAAVETTEHIDIKVAARLADMPLDEFMALNPAHNRPVILQDVASTILLPVNKVDVFMSNLEHHDEPLVSWQAYQSKKGERLDKLAPRFGLTVEKLRMVNGLSSRTKVSSGQKLLVPAKGENADAELQAFNMKLPAFEPVPVVRSTPVPKHTRTATRSKPGKVKVAAKTGSKKHAKVAQASSRHKVRVAYSH